MELLGNGGLDFSIYISQNFGKDIEVFPLSTFSVSCWFRKNHPLEGKQTLSVEDLKSYPHVTLYLPHITDEVVGQLEWPQAEGGLGIKPIFETMQLLVTLDALKHTPLVLKILMRVIVMRLRRTLHDRNLLSVIRMLEATKFRVISYAST